jgi:DNA-binding transcriptional ArsR family regulator
MPKRKGKKMAENKKFTKREKFNGLIDVLNRTGADMDTTPEGIDPNEWMEMLAQFCVAEIALIEKKRNGGSGTNAAKEAENAAIRASITDVLTEIGAEMTATEIATATDMTVQRVSAHLRKMDNVERVEEGKKVRFKIA